MYYIHVLLFLYLQGLLLNSCNTSEIHALILARGGSKGILNKNLQEIDGISLLARTINVLNSSNLFEHIWVSTDNEEIKQEALKFGARVHDRDPFYAQDSTTSLESVKEFLRAHNNVEKFALFQCTSVFLKNQYIIEALKQFVSKDCVFAATRSHKLRWQRQADEAVIPLNFDPMHRPRRQDWLGELIETGMFYFATRHLVVTENRFQNEKCGIVEIDPADAMEIDTYTDVVVAQCLIQDRLSSRDAIHNKNQI